MLDSGADGRTFEAAVPPGPDGSMEAAAPGGDASMPDSDASTPPGRLLVEGSVGAFHLDPVAGHVFWLAFADGRAETLEVTALPSGEPILSVAVPPDISPHFCVVDGTALLVQTDGSVWSASADATSVSALTMVFGSTSHIISDGLRAWAVSSTGAFAIDPLRGVVAREDGVLGPVATGGAIYWSSEDGALLSASVGESATAVGPMVADLFAAVELGDSLVLLAGGKLLRYYATTRSLVTLSEAAKGRGPMVANDKSVYWIDQFEGVLYRFEEGEGVQTAADREVSNAGLAFWQDGILVGDRQGIWLLAAQ